MTMSNAAATRPDNDEYVMSASIGGDEENAERRKARWKKSECPPTTHEGMGKRATATLEGLTMKEKSSRSAGKSHPNQRAGQP